MDTWKYFGITHADHVVCNPTSAERFDELVGLVELAPGARVWEAACGKGELLIRLAERYGTQGTGVDASPYELAVARERAAARVPSADLRFVQGDAAQVPPVPAGVDLAACLGASWIGAASGTLPRSRYRGPGACLSASPTGGGSGAGLPRRGRPVGPRVLLPPRQHQVAAEEGLILVYALQRTGLGPLRVPPAAGGRALRPRPPRRPGRPRAPGPRPPRQRHLPPLGPRHPRLVDPPLPRPRLTGSRHHGASPSPRQRVAPPGEMTDRHDAVDSGYDTERCVPCLRDRSGRRGRDARRLRAAPVPLNRVSGEGADRGNRQAGHEAVVHDRRGACRRHRARDRLRSAGVDLESSAWAWRGARHGPHPEPTSAERPDRDGKIALAHLPSSRLYTRAVGARSDRPPAKRRSTGSSHRAARPRSRVRLAPRPR